MFSSVVSFRRQPKALRRRRLILCCVALAVLLAALGILIGVSHRNNPLPIASFTTEELLCLFDAEIGSGIPLEDLAGVCAAQGWPLTRASEAATLLAPYAGSDRIQQLYAEHPVARRRALAARSRLTLVCQARRDKVFPFADAAAVDFADSWGDGRSFGGSRHHEGTDVFARSGAGTEILSVCDGTVEKKGWLQLGGWRMGIRGDDGIYYYYAHMMGYADLEEGDRVVRGQVLGYEGDTGYGPEGTTGQFEAHLHFGMYQGKDKTEKAFPSYPFLRAWLWDATGILLPVTTGDAATPEAA